LEPVCCKKVKKELWALLDESGTELLKEVLDRAGGNDGVSNEWGFWYAFSSQQDWDMAKDNANNTCKFDEDNMRLQVGPNHALLRTESHEGQLRQAKIMKAQAKAADGNISVGDVVQVGLHWVDQTKVDGKA
jgi:hypothetical protein